jgi:pantoate kinase
MARRSSAPPVTINGLQISSCGLRECIEKVAERRVEKKFRKLPFGHGIGFAASAYTGAGLLIY